VDICNIFVFFCEPHRRCGSAKRARLLPDQSDENIHLSQDIIASRKEDICFEELCDGAKIIKMLVLDFNIMNVRDIWKLVKLG
jgi:hypothetical protein